MIDCSTKLFDPWKLRIKRQTLFLPQVNKKNMWMAFGIWCGENKEKSRLSDYAIVMSSDRFQRNHNLDLILKNTKIRMQKANI